MIRSLPLCLAAALIGAPVLTAQSVPRLSAELSAGRGARTTQAGSVYYAGNREDHLRAGLAIRLGSPGRLRPVLHADYGFGMRGDQVAICGVAPNGSCFQYFPKTKGFSAGLGSSAILLPRLTLGGSMGVARIDETARYIDADLAIGVSRRLAALAHWRRLDWSRAGVDDLWFQPVSFGVRIQ